MGAQLVGKAIAFAAVNDLKPNEFKLLIFMAQTALDTDQLPRYFGSREMSAYGIGLVVADSDVTKYARRRRNSAFELLRRATNGLIAAGAITQTRGGRIGQHAEFTVLTSVTVEDLSEALAKLRERANNPLALPDEGDNSLLALDSNSSSPLQTQRTVGERGNESMAPRNHDDPREELRRRTPQFTEAPHLRPVDNSDGRKSA